MNPIVSNRNKLRFELNNLQYDSPEVVSSNKTRIGNFEWSVRAFYKYKSSNCYLTVNLICDANNEKKNWIMDLNGKISLISYKGTKPSIRWDLRALYNTESTKNGAEMCIDENFFEHELWSNSSTIVDVDFNYKLHDFSTNIPNFTDIIINIEDTEFHLNKGVLSSKSEYFYDLFVNKECKDPKIELKDVKATDFCIMLSSFHKVSNANFDTTYSNLLDLARKFGASSLHHSLEHFLINKKEMEIMEKLKIADENEYEDLLESCCESLKTQSEIRSVAEHKTFMTLKDLTKLRVMFRLLNCL